MLEFVTQPIGNYGPLTWTAGAFVGLLLILLGLGLWLMQASLLRRLTLVSLRTVAIVLLLFAMLQPTLIYTRTEKSRATIAVLLDRSRSMQIVDGAGGKSRWDLMVEAIHKSLPEFDALAEDLDIKFYTFDAHPLPIELKDGRLQLPGEPDGQESAYGQAIDEVRRQEQPRQPLKAMFLVGDGAQRTARERSLPPQAAAGRLRNLGIPLYTVALGENRSQEQARDLAITELNVSPTVFVKNELAVTGMVRAMGFVNQPIKVELLFEVNGELKVVDSEVVKASDHGVELRVDLSYVPEVAGEHKLALRAVPHPSERVVMNNELATFITVLKGGVGVLYVEGRPRMEQKYIRWALGASPNIHVDYHEVDATGAHPLPPEAAEWFQKGKYDAYILGDIDSSAFQDGQLKELRERVQEGAGLMMLGGFNSFGAGGYQRTWLYLDKSKPTNRAANPDADFDFVPSPVLPVKMLATERQDLGERIIESLHLSGSQQVAPTEVGQRHYLLQLTDRAQNDALWQRLPPWEGANRFAGLTSLAKVLARNPQGDPLIVEADFGLGRVVAMAGDSTWRWWMRGFQKEHRRFWRQVVLYLAHKDETDESGVWVRLNRRRFNKNDRVELTAGVQSPEGEPITDATLTGEVLLPDGKSKSFSLVRQSIDFAGVFGETLQAGDYTVVVTAKHTNGETGSARARFIVRDQDLELDNPAAEPGVLSSLAAMTGGKMVAPEQLRGVLEELRAQPMGLEEQKPHKLELWDNWLVMLGFVAALGLEWSAQAVGSGVTIAEEPMGFFDFLFGGQPGSNVQTLEDRIWLSQQAKLNGIRRQLQPRPSASHRTLLLGHFADTVEALQGLAAEHQELPLTVALADQLQGARRSIDLRPDPGATLEVVVAERHPLLEHDENLRRALEELPCRCRLEYHLSLEDAVLKQFGGEWMAGVLAQLGMTEHEPIQSAMVSRRIKAAQQKIQGATFGSAPAKSAVEWMEKNFPHSSPM